MIVPDNGLCGIFSAGSLIFPEPSIHDGAVRNNPAVQQKRYSIEPRSALMHAPLPLMEASDFPTIRRRRTETLQVNLGYKSNQRSLHRLGNPGPHCPQLM